MIIDKYKYYFSLPHSYVYDWSYGSDGAKVLRNQYNYDIVFIRNNYKPSPGDLMTDLYCAKLLDSNEEKMMFVLKTGFKEVVV